MVIEHTSRSERTYGIFFRLFKERVVCINGPISDDTAAIVVAQLLFLDSENPSKPLNLYINSPNGAGLAIYDAIQYIRPPSKRRSLPNARVMIHQPFGGASGQTTDIAIHAKEILKVRGKLNLIYHKHVGQPIEMIEHCMERDLFMSLEEAKEFGIVDEVIESRPIALVSDAVVVGDGKNGQSGCKGKDEGSS